MKLKRTVYLLEELRAIIEGDEDLRELERKAAAEPGDRATQQRLFQAQKRAGQPTVLDKLLRITGATGASSAKHELRKQLGGWATKFKQGATGEKVIDGVKFKLLAQGGPAHRLVFECPLCGKDIPFGRVSQHFDAASHGGKYSGGKPLTLRQIADVLSNRGKKAGLTVTGFAGQQIYFSAHSRSEIYVTVPAPDKQKVLDFVAQQPYGLALADEKLIKDLPHENYYREKYGDDSVRLVFKQKSKDAQASPT